MIFKIFKFSILFSPENHFFIEVSISTKKNLKAEILYFPVKMSDFYFQIDVKLVGGGGRISAFLGV